MKITDAKTLFFHCRNLNYNIDKKTGNIKRKCLCVIFSKFFLASYFFKIFWPDDSTFGTIDCETYDFISLGVVFHYENEDRPTLYI